MTTQQPSKLPTSSILIPSLGRSETLRKCLESLAQQTHLPQEVIVVWQSDDAATCDVATEFRDAQRLPVIALHLEEPGIVPAENLALSQATGDVIVLIDDDAIAPSDWLDRHLQWYKDETIGAVGGPANNFSSDGPFPKRSVEPVGRIHWTGKLSGNMYDHIDQWRTRPARDVDHLVGYNFSLRRSAFDRFDDHLKRYWQLFELEACLQVRARGYRILFDFGNVVRHYPTNTAYVGGRDGDLQVKVLNSLFNRGYIFAKHFSRSRRLAAATYQTLVGNTGGPGVLGACVSAWKYGHPIREIKLLIASIGSFRQGWNLGIQQRRIHEQHATETRDPSTGSDAPIQCSDP